MGRMKRGKKDYFRIYEQIYRSPTAPLHEIARGAGLSRNTVPKYLKHMYANQILIGPYIEMKPHSNYKEYMYMINFSDPSHVFEGLRKFPHVLYHQMTFGDWNCMVITDRLLDLSRLVGFQSMICQGVKGSKCTPKVKQTTWDEGFMRFHEKIEHFRSTPVKKESVHYLNWGPDQWKLYHAFKFNLRKTVTSLLRRIKVRYETYVQWMETLENHCTVHTEFYPEGFSTYLNHCFLLDSEYKESVISLFSLFPSTSAIVEANNQLLVSVKVAFPDAPRKLFCMLYDMKKAKIIKRIKQAVMLSDLYHVVDPEKK